MRPDERSRLIWSGVTGLRHQFRAEGFVVALGDPLAANLCRFRRSSVVFRISGSW